MITVKRDESVDDLGGSFDERRRETERVHLGPQPLPLAQTLCANEHPNTYMSVLRPVCFCGRMIWTESDVKLASVYLGSFCVTSIFVMAAFAAVYGELTARLGYRRDSLLHCMTIGSAMLSLVVGVLWLVLLWFGILDDVFP